MGDKSAIFTLNPPHVYYFGCENSSAVTIGEAASSPFGHYPLRGLHPSGTTDVPIGTIKVAGVRISSRLMLLMFFFAHQIMLPCGA